MNRKILILAANPNKTPFLRLDKEMREIQESLQRSKKREQFKPEIRLAVGTTDLRRALLDEKPYLVHFCGHGTGQEGIILEDGFGYPKFVESEPLANLFELFSNNIECVILNACYTEIQAEEISKHIKYVIGIEQGIEDRAAIEFAKGFYDGIGAGRGIEEAFVLGRNAIELDSISGKLQPILKKKLVSHSNSDKNTIFAVLNKSNYDKFLLLKIKFTQTIVIFTIFIMVMAVIEKLSSNQERTVISGELPPKLLSVLTPSPIKQITQVKRIQDINSYKMNVITPEGETGLEINILDGSYDWEYEKTEKLSYRGNNEDFDSFFQKRLKYPLMQDKLKDYLDVISVGMASCEGWPSTEKDRAMGRAKNMSEVVTKSIPYGSTIENYYMLNLGQFVTKQCSSDSQSTSWQRKILFIGVTHKETKYITPQALCKSFSVLKKYGFKFNEYAAFDLKLIYDSNGVKNDYKCTP
jgi:hypothetical protein